MKKLRVSIVDYLNAAPLAWGLTDGPLVGRYDLSFTTPSLCAEALRSGQVDLAIIPAVEYARIPGLVILPDMAVAAKGEVRSILLLARKPVQLVRRIALDTSSRSSVALVRLLCRGLWRISPEFVDAAPDPSAMLANADAALLIGDAALRVRIEMDALHSKQAAPAGTGCCDGDASDLVIPAVDTLFLYDVAQQWREMTGKPCVLAVWAGRREIVTPQVVTDFLESRDYGLSRIGDIAEGAALKLNLPPSALESYLRDSIDFYLDRDNVAGLELFFSECEKNGLVPHMHSIDFAALPANFTKTLATEAD
jgi:chorismate dehydratase